MPCRSAGGGVTTAKAHANIGATTPGQQQRQQQHTLRLFDAAFGETMGTNA